MEQKRERTKGVVVIGHDVCEGIRDVSAGDDSFGLARFVRQLRSGEIISDSILQQD